MPYRTNDDLPASVRSPSPREAPAVSPGLRFAGTEAGTTGISFKEAKQNVIERFERQFILQALERHQGNISKAAEEMDMYRQHLQLKLAEYGIDPAAYRQSLPNKR